MSCWIPERNHFVGRRNSSYIGDKMKYVNFKGHLLPIKALNRIRIIGNRMLSLEKNQHVVFGDGLIVCTESGKSNSKIIDLSEGDSHNVDFDFLLIGSCDKFPKGAIGLLKGTSWERLLVYVGDSEGVWLIYIDRSFATYANSLHDNNPIQIYSCMHKFLRLNIDCIEEVAYEAAILGELMCQGAGEHILRKGKQWRSDIDMVGLPDVLSEEGYDGRRL